MRYRNKSTKAEHGGGTQDVEKSDDLIKAKFRAHASFGHVDGDVVVCIVDRRFCEGQRTVITSSAFLDPSEISDMEMDSIYMRLKSWIVFEPVVSDASRPNAPTKAATRMISYSVTVPQVFDGLEDQSRKVGTLTNFIMSAHSVELEARQQGFENRLFDRSCEYA
jgi:hypothetical protein